MRKMIFLFWQMSLTFSIIIPSFNEGNSLETMIPNINETIGLDPDDKYEIIVVNSGGTETQKIKKLPMVTVYDSPKRLGAPQARNFGANKASGDILVFADAHLQFEPGWGEKFIRDLHRKRGSIVTPCISAMGDPSYGGCGFEWDEKIMDIVWIASCNDHGIHEIPFSPGAC